MKYLSENQFIIENIIRVYGGYIVISRDEAMWSAIMAARTMFKTAADITNETGNPFLDYALQSATGNNAPQKQAADTAAQDEQLAATAAAVAQSNPIAKQAALTYAHIVAGGALQEDAVEEKQES